MSHGDVHRVIPLGAALRRIRIAALSDEQIVVRREGVGVLLQIATDEARLVTEQPRKHLLGCDLERYSGLSDLQQYFAGAVVPILISRVRDAANLTRSQVLGISGTGDGALVALEGVSAWEAVLFGIHLWRAGRTCAFSRSLRVAVGTGPCMEGVRLGGTVQLQGYGLVEQARRDSRMRQAIALLDLARHLA